MVLVPQNNAFLTATADFWRWGREGGKQECAVVTMFVTLTQNLSALVHTTPTRISLRFMNTLVSKPDQNRYSAVTYLCALR